jgi:hypothetical protein
MRPGEDERSVVIANPMTLGPLDLGRLMPLEQGIEITTRYFTDYLASR